jgi:hypothetical protein
MGCNHVRILPGTMNDQIGVPPLFDPDDYEDDDDDDDDGDMNNRNNVTNNNDVQDNHEEEEDEQPDPSFICPLTLEVMRDPLMDRKGLNFERHAIVEWLNRGNATCPLTREPLSYSKLVPNAALRLKIEQWKKDHNIPLTEPKGEGKSCGRAKHHWDDGCGYWGGGGEDEDDEVFPITVASPLSYQQQVFLVTSLGNEYSLAERRQLMAEYRAYHFPTMASATTTVVVDHPSSSLFSHHYHSSGSSSSRPSRRRRHSTGGDGGGTSPSATRGNPSSSRRDRTNGTSSSSRNNSSNNNNSSNSALTPRARRRLLSVLDNAMAVLRPSNIHSRQRYF